MKKIIILLCCVGIGFSCKSIFKPKDFKYCYTENGDNNVEKRLNLDGYFIGSYQSPIDNDTIFKTIILFKNGICGVTANIDFRVDSIYLEKVLNKSPDVFANPFHWGAYRIVGDTLKVQSLFQMYHWDYYMLDEEFLIINNKQLIRLDNVTYSKDYIIPKYNLNFEEFPHDLEYLCNLKKYKWFKCK